MKAKTFHFLKKLKDFFNLDFMIGLIFHNNFIRKKGNAIYKWNI